MAEKEETNKGVIDMNEPGEKEEKSEKARSRSPDKRGSPDKKSPVRESKKKSKRSTSRSRSYSRSRSRSPRSRSYSRSRSGSPRGPRNPSPSKCLGVFGLDGDTTERDLREEFSRYGTLEKADLIIDKRTGQSRRFAFLYFSTVEDARKGKEACNGMKLHGRNIRTDFSTTARPHSPTPGRYMGRITRPRGPRRVDRYYPSRYESRDRYDPYDDRDRYYRDRRDRYYDDRYRYDDRDRYHDDYYDRRDRY